MEFYLYRFLNASKDIIYIGRMTLSIELEEKDFDSNRVSRL